MGDLSIYNFSKVSSSVGSIVEAVLPMHDRTKREYKGCQVLDDYKWSSNDQTPSTDTIIEEEFWLHFKCGPDVDWEEANRALDINLKNLVRLMFSDLSKEALIKLYDKENLQVEEDEGNIWPKVDELKDAKLKDFATRYAWDALCEY